MTEVATGQYPINSTTKKSKMITNLKYWIFEGKEPEEQPNYKVKS